MAQAPAPDPRSAERNKVLAMLKATRAEAAKAKEAVAKADAALDFVDQRLK